MADQWSHHESPTQFVAEYQLHNFRQRSVEFPNSVRNPRRHFAEKVWTTVKARIRWRIGKYVSINVYKEKASSLMRHSGRPSHASHFINFFISLAPTQRLLINVHYLNQDLEYKWRLLE